MNAVNVVKSFCGTERSESLLEAEVVLKYSVAPANYAKTK